MSKRKRPEKATTPADEGRTWVPLADPAPGATEPIYVAFPAPPDEEALAEAASYLASLVANLRIAREPGKAPPGATHQIETDAEGRKRLVRMRYTAR